MNGEIVGNGLVGNLSGTGSITAVLDYVPSSTTTYEGSYTITPSIEEQTLETENKLMVNDLVIEAIPNLRVPNDYGNTIYIGSDINGN